MMAKVVYLDCFSGASGDMLLGALLDAGLPLDDLRKALGSLAVEGWTIDAARVDSCRGGGDEVPAARGRQRQPAGRRTPAAP